jgi:hypothetical protein
VRVGLARTCGARRVASGAVFTFGEIPAYQGDVSFQAAVSDDRRAVTITFSDVTVELGNAPTDTALTASRSLSSSCHWSVARGERRSSSTSRPASF